MDKNTTDKGWAAMREMLDLEMPVKRRRIFGWWWFGLLLLPIVGYGSWQWLGSSDAQKQKIKDAPTLPMARLAPEKGITNAEPSEQNPQNTAAETTGISNNHIAPTIRKDTAGMFNSAKPEAKSNISTTLIDLKKARLPVLSNLPTSENVPDNIVVQEPLQLTLNLLPILPQSIDIQNNKKPSQQSLAFAQNLKPVKKTSSKRWVFGATSAISTEEFNSINGFTTGLTIDWKFARKWGLRTGAFYNIHTPQGKYRPVASVLASDYRSTVYGDVIVVEVATGLEVTNTPTNSLYGDNVYIPVNRLQRVEVPLTVFWQAAKPLKIIGGLSLTRTLLAKADNQNYSGDYILKLVDRTAEDGASKLSSSELDNWSADAMLGAGVRIGRSFEVGFSAKMPLSKFPGIANPSQSNPNASFAGDRSLGSTRKQNGPVFSLYGTLFF